MRVLLTGAAGLIGRVSTRFLAERGHEVLATDLRSMPAGYEQLPWRQLDVRRPAQVRAVLGDHRPDVVVHLAARHFIPWCERFPGATLQTNLIGTHNIVRTVGELDGAGLVFASSAAVYAPSRSPLRESSALRPDDVYGSSKLMAEQLFELVGRQQAPAGLVVLRLFNTIGPDDPNQHLIPRLVSELRRGGRRLRLGNLDTVRDYIYVDDVASAIVAAVERMPAGLTIANIGTGTGRSVRDAVDTLGTLIGRALEVESVSTQRRAVDRAFLVADTTRAHELFDWKPTVSFAQGLTRTLRAAGVELAPG